MEYFHLIAFALIPIAVSRLLIHILDKNEKEYFKHLSEDQIVLKLPKAYFWLGGCGTLFFGSLLFVMFFFPNGTEGGFPYSVFSILLVLSLYLIISTMIFRIDINKNESFFSYRSIFHKTQIIMYSECISYSENYNLHFFVVETTKKKIHFDLNTTNLSYLQEMLNKNNVKHIK